MRPIVRDLYKRFLIAGRHHPQGLEYVKERVKKEFFENANILSKVSNDAINISSSPLIDQNEINFKKAISKGRFWINTTVTNTIQQDSSANLALGTSYG
eukprot:gene25232-33758_t